MIILRISRPSGALRAAAPAVRTLARAAACAAVAAAGAAHAEDTPSSPWSAYVGAARIAFHTRAEVAAGGTVVPGGDAAASPNWGVAFGVLYQVAPDWRAELALGVPPTTTLSGRGSLASAGELGKVTYGPAVLSLQWMLPAMGGLKPYVGAGVNHTVVLDTQDGFVAGLKVRKAWGAVAQAGVGYALSERWSLALDVKKIWVKTTATGTLPALGNADARAVVRLDPLLATLSLVYRF